MEGIRHAHYVGVRAEVLEQLELAQQALGVLCVVEHATPPMRLIAHFMFVRMSLARTTIP